jgi:hypothetical protein
LYLIFADEDLHAEIISRIARLTGWTGDNVALPTSRETERTLYLRGIVEAADSAEMAAWPKLTDDDLCLFGRIIHFFSKIDFSLNYIVQIMDDNGKLGSEWAGKVARLSITDVMKAIRSSSEWHESHVVAFDRIEENRKLRNMLAHFVVLRFPNDDAYIFTTKSPYDFKRVFGVFPELNQMAYSVADAAQMRELVPMIEGLVKWVAQVPAELSNP